MNPSSSTVTSSVKFILTTANDSEADCIGILLSDPKVATAVRERDRKMLARIFGVATLTYEDVLKERGVTFRNTPRRFEVLVQRQVRLCLEDDILGSVGCAIVARCVDRDKTVLQSAYLRGSRAKTDLPELVGALDRDGIRVAAEQLPGSYPALTKACAGVSKAEAALPQTFVCEDATDVLRWAEYTSAVATLYTQLRTSPNPVYVTDPRPCGSPMDIGAYIMAAEKKPGQTIVPKNGVEFSDIERGMLELLPLAGYEYAGGNGVPASYVLSKRDVFEYIGSAYLTPPALPVWDEAEESTQAPAPEPQQPAVARALSPVGGRGEPEAILVDYLRADHLLFIYYY
jgi:hypothetical protein